PGAEPGPRGPLARGRDQGYTSRPVRMLRAGRSPFVRRAARPLGAFSLLPDGGGQQVHKETSMSESTVGQIVSVQARRGTKREYETVIILRPNVNKNGIL